MGKAPRRPEPPAVQPAPTTSDRAVQEAVAEATQRRKTAKGYRSTILARKMISETAPAAGLQTTLGA